MGKNKKQGFIVTIDGPAASGKSTTARMVAEKLGWLYLDTGAMYRALTLKVLQRKISLDNTEEIGRLAKTTKIELTPSNKGTKVLLDGKDVSMDIRLPQVDKAVGPVCEVPAVREIMVASQRKLGEKGNIVAEGRDMGTVVFPNADLKFFMVASLKERAKRRQKDLAQQGINVSVEDLMNEIERRDQRDSNRKNSPLKKASDALVIDTTGLSIEEQITFVINKIQQKMEYEHEKK